MWGSRLRLAVLSKAFVLVLVMTTAVITGCASSGGYKPESDRSKALHDHIQLGLNYIGEGNRQMARVHLLKALEIDSKSAPAHNGMALLFQLELEKELADEHFRKAISYDKKFTRARNNYGVFLYQEGRYKDAYEQFVAAGEDTAYKLRPQVFLSIGVCAKQLGKAEKAEGAWTKAIALSPRYPQPYLELAEYYYDRKDYARARGYLKTFDDLTRPQARSLWLAVRIADHYGDKNAVASKGLALEKLFTNSRENREYQAWLKNEARH